MVRPCPSCGRSNRIPSRHLASVGRCGACHFELGPLDTPLDVDRQGFDDVVREAAVPVLVDFWAPWCGPCRMAAPQVAETARRSAGRAVVLKVNTDEHPDVAARYGVRGIPNFVVLNRGRLVHQQAGVASADALDALLRDAAESRMSG
jgi:thioredoxin 2